jgi:hypothetical protein
MTNRNFPFLFCKASLKLVTRKNRTVHGKQMANNDISEISESLSATVQDIVETKPRLHEYLVFSQILAEAIESAATLTAAPCMTAQISGPADIVRCMSEIKGRLVQLPKFRQRFNDQLLAFKAGLRPAGVDGDLPQIVHAARSIGTVYVELLAFVEDYGDHRRQYSSEMPVELVHMIEPILASVSFFVDHEARGLLRHMAKYGQDALIKLWTASEKLAAGLDAGDLDMYRHTHAFSHFDTVPIDRLTDLINRVADTNVQPENAVDTHGADDDVPLARVDDGPLGGYLYLLTNSSMPGLVKIGRTQRTTRQRARELSAPTGVPQPFEIILELAVSNCEAAERITHQLLHEYRLNTSREFFKVTTSQAIHTMLEAARLACQVDA